MNTTLKNKKEIIKHLKEKNPVYREILNFYEQILEEQFNTQPAIDFTSFEIKEPVKALQMKEGFPLISKDNFILDIPSSVKLFESLCLIGKKINEKMLQNIQALEEAIMINALNLREVLKRYSDESYLNNIAKEFDINRAILNFLIHMSIRPSIRANVEKLRDQVDLKNWMRGYCPICGSLPHMSDFKGEGQRYLLCSFCSFQWPGERLRCPFCENSDHDKLHYFYTEGQEVYRVDLCDKCKQYIKTVDSRKLNYEPDLNLEDIATIHLDILASEKGFKRPVPNIWGI